MKAMTIARTDPQHPLANLRTPEPLTDEQIQQVHSQNVRRIEKIRVMSQKKAAALGEAFDRLQKDNVEITNKAKVLLHQNQQMHQMLSVARNILVIAEQMVDSKHLTETQYAELAHHVRFLPPMEVIDSMLTIYNNG